LGPNERWVAYGGGWTNLLAGAVRQSAFELQQGTRDLVTQCGLPLLVVNDLSAAKDTLTAGGGGSGSVVVSAVSHLGGIVCLLEFGDFVIVEGM
jgi:hypothetical protein